MVKLKLIVLVVLWFDDAGVEDVKADISVNKLTVIGKVDAIKVRDKLADKIKKNVEILSSPAKKDATATPTVTDKPPEKKSDEKKSEEKKSEEKKPEDKKPEEKTSKQVRKFVCQKRNKFHPNW